MNQEALTLLTKEQVAEKLGVSVYMVTKWTKEGKLKAVIINGKNNKRYRLEDIEAFVDSLI